MASLVPDVIDALVARFGAAPALHGVQILDGPEAAFPAKDFLAVGLSPDDESVPIARQAAGLSMELTTETASVTCMIRATGGGTKVKPRRDRAFALFAAALAVLNADPDLGGACAFCEVVDVVYVPSQGARGAVADVVFVVQARAF